VAAAAEAAADLGATRTALLDVGGAYHTRFMAPARDRLRQALAKAEFLAPETPVIANVDARPHGSPDEWRALLSAQLCSPVRWSQSIRMLLRIDPGLIVYVAPRRSLAQLVEASAPDRAVVAVTEPADVELAAAGRGPLDDLPVDGLPVGDHLLVSPANGVYRNVAAAGTFTTDGQILAPGDVVGMVDAEPVRSPLTGWLMGMLAGEGQRVRKGQPIAWLRML